MSQEEQLEWSNLARAIVQIFLSKRVIFEKELAAIHRELLEAEPVHEGYNDLQAVLQLVESAARLGKFKIEKRRDQTTREPVYCLVNTEKDRDFLKQATPYTNLELNVFRMLLNSIFGEDNNLPTNKFYIDKREYLAEFRQTSSQRLVDSFVNQGWIDEVNGNLVPSHRTLAELKGYLKETFGVDGLDTLKDCAVCKAFFTMGLQCPTENCPTRLHSTCQEKYYRNNQSEDCMNCRENIKQNHIFVGI